jgi:hypothetical protein
MPRPNLKALEAIRSQLSTADSMLDQGLRAIHRGSRLDAMETVYAASCLIEEIVAALEQGSGVETRTSC